MTSCDISPEGPEWLAADLEHSYLFSAQLVTFVATRKLRLVYFDGSSAAKADFGTMDSQDILIWGKISKDKVGEEKYRIQEACEWGRKHEIDGFV